MPLILHGNFKLLPGFTSEDCPAGTIDYQPETSNLRAASNVDRNFQLRPYALRGVYLLNRFNAINIDEDLLCWCPIKTLGQLISQCLKSSLVDLLSFQQNSADNGHYILCTGRQFWQIRWQDSLIETQSLLNIPFVPAGNGDTKIAATRVDPVLTVEVNSNALQR